MTKNHKNNAWKISNIMKSQRKHHAWRKARNVATVVTLVRTVVEAILLLLG